MGRGEEPVNLNGKYREFPCAPDTPHEEARAIGMTVGQLYSQRGMNGYGRTVVTKVPVH